SERDHRLLSYLSFGALGGGEACYPARARTHRRGRRRIKRQIRRCFAPRRDCAKQGVTPGTKRARDSQLAAARSYSTSPQLRTFSAIDLCDQSRRVRVIGRRCETSAAHKSNRCRARKLDGFKPSSFKRSEDF